MKPICVVFADAFAYSAYIKLGGLEGSYSVRKITPGIGYSSNLHYLLFDGKKPDEVGFFTDYSWVHRNGQRTPKLMTKCDEIVTLNNLVRILRRKVLHRSDNIPFCEQSYFRNDGRYKFMEKNGCKIFDCCVQKAYANTMEGSYDEAQKLVQDGEMGIVVILEILDHIGHEVGSSGAKYLEKAHEVLKRTNALFEHFRAKHPQGICILISDHGMVDVRASIDIMDGMKKHFGLPGDRYQIYNDSLYLRVWSEKEKILYAIQEHLDSIDAMYRIRDDIRQKYGVTKKEYGQLIYLLREGYSFDPNCFGVAIRGGSYGLHGYMEPSNEASGILVMDSHNEDDISALDVFQTVSELII